MLEGTEEERMDGEDSFVVTIVTLVEPEVRH
jgi:hypothetical protein